MSNIYGENGDFEIVCYDKPTSVEEPREILLLLCDRVSRSDEETPSQMCKIKYAPRQFDSIKVTDFEAARLYYWSAKDGGRILAPLYKVEKGIIRMEREALLNYVRKETKAGNGLAGDAMEEYLQELNQMNCHFTFCETGFYDAGDRFSSDWATSELKLFYKEKAFCLDGQEVISFYLCSHWEVEEAWEQLKGTIKGGSWTKEEFDSWLAKLDTYDTRVEVLLRETDGTVKKTRIRMDGGKRI